MGGLFCCGVEDLACAKAQSSFEHPYVSGLGLLRFVTYVPPLPTSVSIFLMKVSDNVLMGVWFFILGFSNTS